jgi:LysM repeat protein
MKIPDLFQPRKKLHATARAVPKREEYDEPNMKLSSAFIVVLVLHVVAVGGIYAFNRIKGQQASPMDEQTHVTQKQTAKSEADSTQAMASNASATSTNTTKTHVVKVGETFAKIAVNNGLSVEELEEANGLKSAVALRVGQEIRIPTKAAAKTAEMHKTADAKTAADVSAKHAKDTGELYTVVKGENPVAIAKRFGVSYDELLKLNKIDDPKKLQIGQKLRIPAKSKTN